MLEQISAALTQSFSEFSIAWLLISAGIGGLIGALIKFVFEQLLSPSIKRKKATRIALRTYSYPLLQSANNLLRNVEFMHDYVEKKWFDDTTDDYYRLSVLYHFGRYFGLCKILENETILEFETSKKAKNFSIRFYNVFKSITSFSYFMKLSDFTETNIQKFSVPRMALTAIGELMIQHPTDNTSTPSVISFVNFTKKIKTDENFIKWFGYLEKNLLKNLTKSESSVQWNRLIIFAVSLRVFIAFLDPKRKLTNPKSIYYLSDLHSEVKKRVEEEIEKAGNSNLIMEQQK